MKNKMKSPFTGGKVILRQEDSELIFRKERFKYVYLYYQCEETSERFTTTDLDEINMSQIYNQYRIKYGIPFPDEIRHIRSMYDLSASKMSEILGFGDNQYRLYENGDMPSEANGKIISSIKDPSVFKVFVQNAKNQFLSKDFDRIQGKLNKALAETEITGKEKIVFDSYYRGAYNGYAIQSYIKLKNILLYFIKNCDGVFNTKMNKLLFFTDFLAYKTYGCGISGLAYKAIQFGPVPVRWDRVYSMMDDITPEIVEFGSNNCGTRLCSDLSPDYTCFSNEEIQILDRVLKKFKDTSSTDISKLSHQEDIWIKYYATNEMIDYREAFTLGTFNE